MARYWNGGGPQPPDGREGRASGFDRYRTEIDGKAALPGMTKKALHELLLERHAGDEPPVPGYNAFTHYLRTRGILVGAGAPEAHPRFETEPGEQLQFDWKEDVVMHDRSGAEYRFNVFSATLGWSRRHLFRRSPTRTRDDLLACMYDAAVRLGGVAAEWLTDNMSAIAAVGGDGRRARDLDRRVEKANFPYVKTLADFDWSFQPSIDRPVVEELASLGFLERRENVVLVGSPGVGKTHIAVALGVEAVRARKLTYFVDCQRLVGDLKRAAEKGALERRMRFYAHLSLLIVDEVGYLEVDKEGADLLFQLVSRRYERRSTIVTTNVGIGAWAKVFGDPVVASAIADRLCHHCTVLKITERSYRTKDLAPDRDAGSGA